VLLQWEDFSGTNAERLLERYRDRLCTFNDDIQGTAAVAAGALLSAIDVTGVSLTEQCIALFGAGSAGIGIATLLLTAMKNAGLSEAQARRRFYAVDKDGLLIEDMPGMRPAQKPFALSYSSITNWDLENEGHISLLDVARNARPTTLIAVSGQAGAFTEKTIRAMAASVERPVIFPLSNPTSRCEATPEDLMKWTEGRALIGTGSPFAAVNWNGCEVPIDETNNSYIFPGLGLGILSADARRVTDTMFMAAAKCLAELSPARSSKSRRLLPPVSELRSVSIAVAKAVALQAIDDGVASPLDEQTLESRIRANVWEPKYLPYRFGPVS
jgi:malate dehydrogenase (oxaloacetate-decarboxylating)